LGELCYGFIDRPNRPENLEVEPEEEVDAEKKALIFCEVEKAIKEMRDKMATGMMMHPGCTATVGRKWSQNYDVNDQQHM
jgi:hypothetical protein